MKKPRSLCKQKTLRDRRPSRRRLKQSASDRRESEKAAERLGEGDKKGQRAWRLHIALCQTARHQWNAFIFITPDQNNRDVYFENLTSHVI